MYTEDRGKYHAIYFISGYVGKMRHKANYFV